MSKVKARNRDVILHELYSKTAYLVNHTDHIYNDIIKETYLDEVRKLGDQEFQKSLEDMKDLATKKSHLIMLCLK